MKKIIINTVPDLIEETSSKLYRDRTEAVLELILNGVDAVTARGNTQPLITIKIWNRGQHPFVSGKRGMSITDNGCGFSDAVVEAYCKFGRSVHTNQANMHGTHGLGKFAAFALCKETRKEYMIVSDPNDGEGIRKYTLRRDDIFNPDGFTPEKMEPDKFFPHPAPFTTIFIPDLIDEIDADQLASELGNLLPMRPMVVMVEGKTVPKREFVSQSTYTTPSIPYVGVVKFEFAVAKSLTTRDEGVVLVDADTGRLVCELHMLSPGIKRKISGWVLHPRLQGYIHVSGIEKSSSASRSGLDSHFWNMPKGQRLMEAINIHGDRLAKALVDETGTESTDAMSDTLREVQHMFWTAFGKPETFNRGTDHKTKVKDDGKEQGGKHNYPPDRKPTTPTTAGEHQKRWAAKVEVEGRQYGIMIFPSGGGRTPAYVIRDQIVIDTDHPEIVRLLKAAPKNARLLTEGMIRAIIEAHVAFSHETSPAMFAEVYRLAQILFSAKKK